MTRKMIYLILVLLAAPIILCAAPPQAPDSAIAPFLDDLTIAAARLDVSRVDADALADFLVGLMPEEARVELDAQAKQNVAHVNEWKARMLRAGINEIYAVFSLNDLGRKPPIFVVADGSGPTVTPDVLEALTSGDFRGSEHTTIAGATVLGNPAVLERIRSMNRSTTGVWAGIFEAVPPGVLQIVIKPYVGWDRVVEELLPTLPQVVGGGPSTAFTRGMQLAWLSLEASPNMSLRVEVQSESTADAEALRQVIAAGLESLGNQAGPREALPNWDAIQAALTPKVQDDRLVLNLDGDRVRELAEAPVAFAINMEERQADALRTASVHNLKQIGLAIHTYAADHDDVLPEHLAQLLPYVGTARPLLDPANSRALPEDFDTWPDEMKSEWIGEHSAYVYILPGKTLKEIAPQAIVLHEKPGLRPCDDSVASVFADGHVEILASREELEGRIGQSAE